MIKHSAFDFSLFLFCSENKGNKQTENKRRANSRRGSGQPSCKNSNNGLFFKDGHISKIDTAENNYMTDYSANLFKKIIDSNIVGKNANIYFSIVPDKNAFLAEKNGYPSIDYDGFIERMKEKTDYMKYIDITSHLSLNDYYATDTHWKQEEITDIAEYLAKEMGTDVKADYKVNTLENPFYGVYAGQYALPVKPDIIK